MSDCTKTYSGNQGKVTKGGVDIAHIIEWNLTETTKGEQSVTSDTDGETCVTKGNSNSTGGFTALALDDAVLGIEDGDFLDVELVMNKLTGRKKTGRIFVENVDTGVNVDSGGRVEQKVSFNQDGKLTTA